MSTDSTRDAATSIARSDSSQYRCPFCEAEYTHEILTRIHVTRSDDDSHKNHAGFTPETAVECVADDGTISDPIPGQGTNVTSESLDLSIFAEDYDQRQRHILKVGAVKAEAGYSEVHERANNVLDVRDMEPVSYEATRRWLREFYTPQLEPGTGEQSETATDPETESLGSLTPKQQAIVIAHLDDPDASTTELADRAGCSVAYPSTVLERASGIVECLSDRLDADESLDALLAVELTVAERDRLAEDDLLEPTLIPTGSTDPVTSEPLSGDDSVTDRPVSTKTARFMSAAPGDVDAGHQRADTTTPSESLSPENPDGQSETESELSEPSPNGHVVQAQDLTNDSKDSQAGSESVDRPDTPSADTESKAGQSEFPGGQAPSDFSDADMIPRSELEALRDRIQFVRRIAEQELNSQASSQDTRAQSQFALAQELETEFENVLNRKR